MATTYSSTIDVNVWKEHTCVSCGTVFRYLFKRKKTGQGGNPQAAERAAHKAVIKALEHEVDMQPCPGCGLYQPDMIAIQRSRRHWWVFWIGLAVLLVVAFLALPGIEVFSFSMASWVLAFCGVVLGVAHLGIDLGNPNANLQVNHRLARERESRGDLWVPRDVEAEDFEPSDPGRGIGVGHLAGYALLGVGVLALLAPALLKLAMGWPSNPEWVPEVVGPGDEAYIWFPKKIGCVKGLWNGTATVGVANARELGLNLPTLSATTKTDSWGNTISVKSSEKNSHPRLWVRVHLPNDPNLVGKTLKLNLSLAVRYPVAQGNRFSTTQETVGHQATLQVSKAGAGKTFKSAWWACLLMGLTLLLGCSVLLALASSSYRKQALPTSIFVPEKPCTNEGVEEDKDERPRQARASEDHDEGRIRRRDEADEDDRPGRHSDRYRE
jgi:hypothetical protein